MSKSNDWKGCLFLTRHLCLYLYVCTYRHFHWILLSGCHQSVFRSMFRKLTQWYVFWFKNMTSFLVLFIRFNDLLWQILGKIPFIKRKWLYSDAVFKILFRGGRNGVDTILPIWTTNRYILLFTSRMTSKTIKNV